MRAWLEHMDEVCMCFILYIFLCCYLFLWRWSDGLNLPLPCNFRDSEHWLLVRIGSSVLDCGAEHLLGDLWCDIVVKMISETEVFIKTLRRQTVD